MDGMDVCLTVIYMALFQSETNQFQYLMLFGLRSIK